MRKVFADLGRDGLIYMLCDSSPRAGREWLFFRVISDKQTWRRSLSEGQRRLASDEGSGFMGSSSFHQIDENYAGRPLPPHHGAHGDGSSQLQFGIEVLGDYACFAFGVQ